MLREIIRPTSDSYVVHIPKEYINTDVEILVLPFSLRDDKPRNNEDRLKMLESGPIICENDLVSWESSIKKGYENWQIR